MRRCENLLQLPEINTSGIYRSIAKAINLLFVRVKKSCLDTSEMALHHDDEITGG